MAQQSLFFYFSQADFVVKLVMLLLLLASFFSWLFIFQRFYYFRNLKAELKAFEERFWGSNNLSLLYASLDKTKKELNGISAIFYQGFKNFLESNKQTSDSESKLEAIIRSMRIVQMRESECLERHLPFLASVGSISPYIGLFGTVWGIMSALQALGQVQQANIAMVAPGISEALVATALGLFAAIPAVLAYNRFVVQADKINTQYRVFQDEFMGLIQRQLNHE